MLTIVLSEPQRKSIAELEERLNEYLPRLVDFMKDKNLTLFAPKSSSTLFTASGVEMKSQLDINIRRVSIPHGSTPKILGKVLDISLKFAKVSKKYPKKLRGRNRILRTLAGTTWGKSKDTIATRYKTFGRSIIDYVAPVWTAGLSDTQWRNIQTGQENALSTSTGCHSSETLPPGT